MGRMKIILLFFITLSVCSFAQGKVSDSEFLKQISKNFPDSIYLVKGWPHQSCFIKSIDDEEVKLCYTNNEFITLQLMQLKEIKIDSIGTIYKKAKGFTIDLKLLKKYLDRRYLALSSEFAAILSNQKALEEKLEKNISILKNRKVSIPPDMGYTAASDEKIDSAPPKINKWSFGFNYIPYNSGVIYSLYEYDSPESMPALNYGYSSTIKMEGEFSYKVMPRLSITANLGYMVSNQEDNSSINRRYIPSPNYENSSENEDKIKIFNFILGIRYYLIDLFNQKSSAFVFAGVGKQFAFASSYHNSFNSSSTSVNKPITNGNDFIEDLNSPYRLNIGFGAEYFFNESITVKSFIRLNYCKSSADYNAIFVNSLYEVSKKYHFEKADTNTEIGLGLNFYF